MKLFLSYKFKSEELEFVHKISERLSKKKVIVPFLFEKHAKGGDFVAQLNDEIDKCRFFILFWGKKIGVGQNIEIPLAKAKNKTIIPVKLPDHCDSEKFGPIEPVVKLQNSIEVTDYSESSEIECCDNIIKLIGKVHDDGLPEGYPFDYEKTIIENFIENDGSLSEKYMEMGCPPNWPRVQRPKPLSRKGEEDWVINKVSEEAIGTYRDIDVDLPKENRFLPENMKDPQVLSAAIDKFHDHEKICLTEKKLTFPEAGPRYHHYYPRMKNGERDLKVGIVVSGGIAPGINSVLLEIIKRHLIYAQAGNYNLKIDGFSEGFKGMLNKPNCYVHTIIEKRAGQYTDELKDNPAGYLSADFPNELSQQAGSFLATSRCDDLISEDSPVRHENLQRISQTMVDANLDILYVVGGDGSMKAARAISTYVNKDNDMRRFSVIGIPKTMDNDILWVWQSFGFPSAVEWARAAVHQLYDEAKSNPRLCIIQLFGTDSGFVVSHVAQSSGVCDLVLAPEVKYSLEKVSNYIIGKLNARKPSVDHPRRRPYGIILLAENSIPIDAKKFYDDACLNQNERDRISKFIDEEKFRVSGQTDDELRAAGLKLLANKLQADIRNQGTEWKDYRVFTNEPRHLIRSIPPSSADIIIGERLGSLAVDCAMAGYREFMISQWLTEFAMIPLEIVVLGRKRIPSKGIFWRNVISKTGQPSDMT